MIAEFDNSFESGVNIKVIGVGGGGNNAVERMIAARDDFNNLYSDHQLTAEALQAATEKYNSLIEDIEYYSEEMRGFNIYAENEGIVVPTDYAEEEKNAGNVTKLRINFIYLAVGCIALGLFTTVIYFSTSKKFDRKEPRT